MAEFLSIVLAFPTVLYTGLLGLAVLYWLFVIVGALDVNLLDPGAAADGAVDGALKGAAELAGSLKGAGELAGDAAGALKGLAEGGLKGAGELAGDAAGALKGAAEGGLKGAADGGLKGAADAAAGKLEGAKQTAGLLGALKLKDVPVTVTGSLLLLWSWAFSYLGTALLAPLVAGLLPAWLIGAVVMVLAVVLGYPIAQLSARPFAGLFATEVAQGHEALVGQIVAVSTLRVDAAFGQASLDDGQGGLLLQVRCPKSNALQRGDEALIVSYDTATQSFLVEPLDPALAADDRARQRAMARVARERP
jgi:hypothetical protein